MNLVANNCVGARMYELSGRQFVNPFTWCAIDPSDFITLIRNFDGIDFYNTDISFEKRHKGNTTILCRVDDCVDLHYIHYIYMDCDLVVKKPDVYGRDILDDFKSKYFRRLDRMTERNEKPTFLMSFNYTEKTEPRYLEYVEELLSMDRDDVYVFAHKSVVKNPPKSKTNLILLADHVMKFEGVKFSRINLVHFFPPL